MALPNPATGDIVAATDITGIKDHLEGANTAPWLLKAAAGSDLILRAASGRSLRFQDSAAADLLVLTSGQGISPSGLILPASAAPAQTADGEVKWDSVNKWFTVGDGTSRKTFKPAGTAGTMELVGSNTAEQTTTSTSEVDLVTVTLTRSVLVSEGLRIVTSYRKTAGAAAEGRIGLKINTTVVCNAATGSSVLAYTSTTNQAEDGVSVVDISPRSANYLGGVVGSFRTVVSATGAGAQAPALTPAILAALIPNASITSITIRGIAMSASLTLGVKEVKVYAY